MIKNIIIIVLCVFVFILTRRHFFRLLKRLFRRLLPRSIRIFLEKQIAGVKSSDNEKKAKNIVYPTMTTELESAVKNAIRITFTGDLILLKDMVENGYNPDTGRYGFDSMFEYVKDYYDQADYNIGIFEGPVAGEKNGYSTSCFNDGIPIYLNFPKEYAQAVRRAGFDMVSLANNHLLDQGVSGVYQTLDELDQIGLSHIGAYRNQEEKSSAIKMIEICGKKIALLAYTYGSNYYKTEFFFKEENNHLTSLIVSPKDEYFKECIKNVKRDFEMAKNMSPDVIIVLPHMGKQFRHEPDEYQKYWCNVFVEFGADIVLADHPHAVQPIQWVNKDGRNALVVYCPGNYINSYIARDGDASMIVECYINSETGKPFASACIPIYAYSRFGRSKVENYKGIPIYHLIKDEKICPELSRYEYNRIQAVQKLVTKTALGVELGLDNIQKRYYLFANMGYVRQPIDISQDSCISNYRINLLDNAGRIAFIGDSLTEGTMNGGYGWFEPMMQLYPDKQVLRFAKGSRTSMYFKEHKKTISMMKADLYFLAMGCNDIRYRNAKTCAMNEMEFVKNIEEICQAILIEQPTAAIVCISPWRSGRYDPFCKMTLDEKERMYDKYSMALKKFCEVKGFKFVNPNPYIEETVSKRDRRYYMLDHIHCNADQGIKLYSEAVLKCCAS